MKRQLFTTSLVTLSLLAMAGCAKDDDAMQSQMFQITVTNLTNNQVLTPPAAIVHDATYTAWALGSAASVGLEKLAESGDSADFISAAMANTGVLATKALSAAPIAPGASATNTVDLMSTGTLYLSLASMLANTNDAFAGVDRQKISDLQVGQSHMVMTTAFDAGTEANSETAATIPGPAGGGAGFDAARDDIGDFVSVHAGVVTMDDGLSTSVLNESYRWNGPVAKVVVTRTR